MWDRFPTCPNVRTGWKLVSRAGAGTLPEKKYDTPLVKKLGIKPASRLLLVDEPEGFRELLIDLPADVIEVNDGEADVIVVFFTVAADVKKQVPPLKKRLAPGGGLW